MKTIVQLGLNFLLNAIWQVAAIALAAVVGNYLLRSVTRFRHALWVTALIMSLALPLLSVIVSFKGEAAPAKSADAATPQSSEAKTADKPAASANSATAPAATPPSATK